MYLLKRFFCVLAVAVGVNSTAAELSIKYPFIPSHELVYPTSIVKPAKTLKQIETAIISPPIINIPVKQPEIQVVGARNYPDQQPLSPTISYSYNKAASTIAPESVVVPAKNYLPKLVSLTYSDLYTDQIQTYVVSPSSKAWGYSQLSKGELVNIERLISQNSLIGCAPLSINCSRTATDSDNLDIERGPLKAIQTPKSQQRQVITQ